MARDGVFVEHLIYLLRQNFSGMRHWDLSGELLYCSNPSRLIDK